MTQGKTRNLIRALLTEQLRVILEQRSVRIGVISALLIVASLFNLIPAPIALDSGWMFIVPVAISAIAAGLGEGLVVALAASGLCGLMAGFGNGGFDQTLALSIFSARFALYGITAVVLGAFAEAHYSVQSNLRALASLDPLTQVLNVASFYRQMRVLENQSTDFVVLLVDVDDLKKINDTYGHQAGTEAIRAVAKALRRVVRGSDCLARYGGDEFVIILRETDLEGAQIVINRLKEILAYEKIPSAPSLAVSASVGVAVYGVDGKSSEELLEAADRRMYGDKEARKPTLKRRSDPDEWGISQTS
jgi:diguanylate cyclase (GGDEF)-like protein